MRTIKLVFASLFLVLSISSKAMTIYKCHQPFNVNDPNFQQGDELYLDLETYMARVEKRVPPAQKGEKRGDLILEMSFGGSRLAHVKARMKLMGRDYLDYLTLIRSGDEWRIVAKIFAYVPGEIE